MSNIIINSQGPHIPNGRGVNTGFAKVAYGVATALAPNHTVNHLCNEHQGLPFEYKGFTIQRGNADFTKNASELKLHVENRKPDYVIGIGEAWMMRPYQQINFGDTKLIMHVPVDGSPLDTNLNEVSIMADVLVPASHFGKKVMETCGLMCSDVIPHSFDPEIYYPFKQVQRDKIREDFGITDEFVVGFVGRQQERKNMMALVIAFANFAKDKDDARLMINTTMDKYSDFNLIHLVKFLGIGDKTFIVKQQGYKESEIAEMYNVMDVYFTTSCSEGFNLPVLEAQACGVPCVVSNYSAHVELVNGHGKLIKIDDYRPMQNEINWAYVNIDDASAQLQYYYDNKNARRKDGVSATKFVNEFYRKDIVAQKWNDLIANYDAIKEEIEARKPVRRMDINVTE